MKRMIDNKEFDKLKNDVNDLNEKVNNIKGVPTITIDVSQMTSLNTFNLSDEQIEALENNSAVYVILPNGNSFTLLKETLPLQTNDYINFVSLSFDINQDEQVENYIYAVSINKDTKTGNVEVTKIESGKQLYQHNIFFDFNLGGTNYGFISINIETESNIELTETTLKNYFSTTGKFKNIEQGTYFDGTNNKNIVRLGIDTGNPDKFRIAYLSTLISGLQYLTLTNHTISNFSDNVIPL